MRVNGGGPIGRGSPPRTPQLVAARRESDRFVRPLRPGNAGGGRDLTSGTLWRKARSKRMVIGQNLETPEKIRNLQKKLYLKAKTEPGFRFYLLYDKVWRADILEHAYALARDNRGAAGVDGVTFAAIESAGRKEWLSGIGKAL